MSLGNCRSKIKPHILRGWWGHQLPTVLCWATQLLLCMTTIFLTVGLKPWHVLYQLFNYIAQADFSLSKLIGMHWPVCVLYILSGNKPPGDDWQRLWSPLVCTLYRLQRNGKGKGGTCSHFFLLLVDYRVQLVMQCCLNFLSVIIVTTTNWKCDVSCLCTLCEHEHMDIILAESFSCQWVLHGSVLELVLI